MGYFDYISALPICSWILVFIKTLPVIFLVSFPVSLLFKKWRQKVISKLWTRLSVLKVIYIFIAIIISFALLILFVGLYSKILSFQCNIPQTGSTFELKDIDANFALAFLGTVTGLVALFGGYLTILRAEENERQNGIAQKEADIKEQEFITDQINKATELLSTENKKEFAVIEVRLNAIYTLKKIAEDNESAHMKILEILCAYIRGNSPLPDKKSKPKKPKTNTQIDKITENYIEAKKLREDIQAALTIIGQRMDWTGSEKLLKMEEQRKYRVDLSHCDLSGAQLYMANLSRSRLFKTDISHSNLAGADLSYADIDKADLSDSILDNTNLIGAHLFSTITRKISIREGDISECKYLVQEQLEDMYCGIKVKIPSNLKRSGAWPDEELNDDKSFTDYLDWAWDRYGEDM